MSNQGTCNLNIYSNNILSEIQKNIYYNLKNLLNPNCPYNLETYNAKNKITINNIDLLNDYLYKKLKMKIVLFILYTILNILSIICIIKIFI